MLDRDMQKSGGALYSTALNSANLIPYKVTDYSWFKIFVVAFAAAIVQFWWLAYKCDIIREPGPQPGGRNSGGKPNRKPYSLARTQMAFGFLTF